MSAQWHSIGTHVYYGEYAAEGEPDVWITVELAEFPEDLAHQIALALNARDAASLSYEGAQE